MSKNNQIRTIDAIPLPGIIRDSLIEIPYGFPYVSRTAHFLDEVEVTETRKGGGKVKVKKLVPASKSSSLDHGSAPSLTEATAHFYIGKVMRRPFKKRVFDLLGWKTKADNDEDKEGLYNEEFIEASLAYLFEYTPRHEKVTWVIGRYLSELFNGDGDTDLSLSTEEEVALVKRVAQKVFPNEAKRLNVVLVEEMPSHQLLFATLNEHKNAENGMQRLLDEYSVRPVSLSADPSSQEVAHHLCYAFANNKMVRQRILSMVPTKMREAAYNENIVALYAIVELATRLVDLFDNTYVQGGANRQSLYDDFIAHIIQGPKGKLRGVKELKELLECFEGITFVTLHVDNKVNPPTLRKIRNAARSRIAMMGLAIATAVSGGVHIGRTQEQQEEAALQEAIDQSLAEELKDETFYIDYKWPIPKEQNVKLFHRAVEDVLTQLQERYQISEAMLGEFKLPLEEFLLTTDSVSVSSMNVEIPMIIRAADEFVRQKKYLFIAKGISIQEPYQHLDPYTHLFDKTQNENFSQVEFTYRWQSHIQLKMENDDIEHIGNFRTGHGYGSEDIYELVVFTDESGQQFLLAAKNSRYYRPEAPLSYTSKIAREFVCHYVKAKQLFEVNKIRKYDHLLQGLNSHNIKYSAIDDLEVDSDDYRMRNAATFTAFPSGIKYEVAEHDQYVGPGMNDKVTLVARRYGEGKFTSDIAKEVALFYEQVRDKTWKFGDFCNESSDE